MQTIFFHPTLTLEHPLSDASIHHYDELEETIKRLVTNPFIKPINIIKA